MITIDGYRIDASLTESHKFPSEATKYPREAGTAVTDHVINNPIMVTIEGIVSDSPIGVIKAVRESATATGDGDLEFLPSDEALAKLLAIRAAREPVIIETSLKVFEEMVMTDLDIPCDPETGHALRFTATFEQTEIVTNLRSTVHVEPVAKGNRPPVVIEYRHPDHATSVNGYPISWNSKKGRFEYSNKAGQPGGTPVPNNDMPSGTQTEAQAGPITDIEENHLYYDQGSSEWRNSDGTSVTQDQLTRHNETGPWWLGD